MKALLIEDNFFSREVINLYLLNQGVEVVTANDGKEGVEMAQVDQFDIILMDYNMPVMDGAEATQLIRKMDGYTDTPIIGITAALKGNYDKCRAAGMSDYIPKPFVEADLDTILRKWLPQMLNQPSHQSMDPALVMDTVSLQKLRSSARDKFPKIVDIYKNDASNLLAAINKGLEAGDLAAVQFAAHSLRTASGQIGAIGLEACMRTIEEAAKLNDMATVQENVPQGYQWYGRVEEALKRLTRAH